MGILNFFKRVKLGFSRLFEESIPYVTEEKVYGNEGECEFVNEIKSKLPSCAIKQNVIINCPEGNAEIDCLLLYQNKLFAIEIKCWKGYVTEQNGEFIQRKIDQWTDEVHEKYHKSPFSQLGRAIYLLRKQFPTYAWINNIVFFEEADSVEINDDNVWFTDINDIINYIKLDGRTSQYKDACSIFKRANAADCLYSKSWDKSLHCIILDESLKFETSNGIITKSDISNLAITHHWSYDEVCITLKNTSCVTIKLDNAKIKILDNREIFTYALCKLDYITIG